MGVFYTIPLHGSVRECVDYISNPQKIIPQEITMRLLTYTQSHAAESAVSIGCNGCYGSKEIALQQFRACEKLYNKKHNAKKRGVVGEHLIFSLATGEKADMHEILQELMALPDVRDFYAYGNTHHNTDELHLHVVICNYSKDGGRKLSMNKSKRYRLRNELDHICVRHGLSIIDEPVLALKYPEREQWIEDLVRNGTVRVFLPANALEIKHPNRHLRWMIGQYHAGRVGICKRESFKGKFEQPTKQAKQIAIHAAHKAKAEAYAVRTPGRKPSLDEQLRRAQDRKVREFQGRTDRELQDMMDNIAICRELNIRNPDQFDERIREIGDAIGRTDRSLAYQRRIAQETASALDTEYEVKKRKKAAERVAALEKKRLELSRQYRKAMWAKGFTNILQYRLAYDYDLEKRILGENRSNDLRRCP